MAQAVTCLLVLLVWLLLDVLLVWLGLARWFAERVQERADRA